MTPERYDEILDLTQKVDSRVGDIPDSGGSSIIQDRLRSFTDSHSLLKGWSSEARLELNTITKVLKAARLHRKLQFDLMFSSVEIQAMPISQEGKRKNVGEKLNEEDKHISKLEDWLGDLQTLLLVLENRLDAVKVSTSNLRKEWELLEEQHREQDASEKIRRVRASVEDSQESGVLVVESGSDPKEVPNSKEPGSNGVSKVRVVQEINVDDLLNTL